MQVGIMSRTYRRDSLDGVLNAVVSAGFRSIQFNLSAAGLDTLPSRLPAARARAIGDAVTRRGLAMAAISGTFNLIHPDETRRREGLARLGRLAESCQWLGTRTISLCTGTLDPDDMWTAHADNDGPGAWRALCASIEDAIAQAEQHEVVLAVEPEPANVMSTARHARRLLDDLRAPRLKVLIDPANLAIAGDPEGARSALDEAFQLLGEDVVLAHAKDLSAQPGQGFVAAGKGCIDFERYIRLLDEVGYSGPLILHGLTEHEVGESVAFLERLTDGAPMPAW